MSAYLRLVTTVSCATSRKPCSGYKLKEITGSGIFAANSEDGTSESDAARTGLRVYQVFSWFLWIQDVIWTYKTSKVYHVGNSPSNLLWLNFQQAVNGISQISFSVEESVSPKKPTSLPEVAKQRELSGTLQSESDLKNKKLISNAKNKELSGHDIFGPPPEIVPRSVAASRTSEIKESRDMGEPAPRNLRTSVKVSNVSTSWAWKWIFIFSNYILPSIIISMRSSNLSLCCHLLIHHAEWMGMECQILCIYLNYKCFMGSIVQFPSSWIIRRGSNDNNFSIAILW